MLMDVESLSSFNNVLLREQFSFVSLVKKQVQFLCIITSKILLGKAFEN
jgi:hypothetical protein